MRSGAAEGHTGYFHETAFYGSDEELLAVVVPFLRDGVKAGEPTLVTCAEHNAGLIRAALPDTGGVTFLPGATRYARPAVAIKEYRAYLAEQVARGVPQIRVVGDVPHPGTGADWSGWLRYEAAVNIVYDEFPIWGLCPYDLRTSPTQVLADVYRTHPWIATPDGRHTPNARFLDPSSTLTGALRSAPPIPAGPPAVELAAPTPRACRQAVLAAGAGTSLDTEAIEDLVFAASEAVTNAYFHGHPPVLFRLWAAPDELVVAITDHGSGPADPLAGLLPVPSTTGAGLGLWITHQLRTEVHMTVNDTTYTIHLTVRSPG